MKNKNDIISLTCIYLIVASLNLGWFVDNSLIVLIFNNTLKLAFIAYYFYYIKKYGLPYPKVCKTKILKYLPIFILTASNFFVCFYNNYSVNTDINSFDIISGLVNSLLTGICEELVFRAILAASLENHYQNRFKSILISALIFGLVHLLNISSIGSIIPCIIQSLYCFIIGIIVGYLYLNTKNIILSIMFHVLFNFLNNELVTILYDLKWDLSFFIINIIVGLFVLVYIYLLSLMDKKDHCIEQK